MPKDHYFICRDEPFLLLGRDKWLSVQELAEGTHAIYSFPTAKQAQGVQAILPKAMKPGTKIRGAKSIEKAFDLVFVPGKGFSQAQALNRGPGFEAPFRNESLIIFVLPGHGKPPAEEPLVPETLSDDRDSLNSDISKDFQIVSEEPVIQQTAITALNPSRTSGRDTTVGNDSVAMFEDLLQTLEQGIRFRDTAPARLTAELSTADREIMDELHFLEFNQLNAVEGFKVYQRLRDLRLKRRGVKDSALIAGFLDELLVGINQSRLNEMHNRLAGLRSRKYALREPETFAHPSEGGIIA